MKHSYLVGFGALALLASCMTPPTSSDPLPDAPSSSHASHAPARPSSTPVRGGSALTALAHLPVKGRAPKTGYSRAQFGEAWTDDNDEMWGRNGCDTRNDVLRRDLADVVLRSDGCKVATGTLRDPYTAKIISFVRGPGTSSLVQIDHSVSVVLTRAVLTFAGQDVSGMLPTGRRLDAARPVWGSGR
ncbi:hypothetical protein [Nocardioides baekrokdamisoli]|uniref:hypothetical protein n=1 Tax=Nocardioides baekrokdamisoli TaxID=1804624 RepID=UPI000F7ADB65|nr:hypothetical protein [Nocardioides baekrokdamisoli]